MRIKSLLLFAGLFYFYFAPLLCVAVAVVCIYSIFVFLCRTLHGWPDGLFMYDIKLPTACIYAVYAAVYAAVCT